MPLIDKAFAERFASEWISAWNAHDMDAILSHYADDFEFSSPNIILIACEPSGTLKGKAAIRAYWTKALGLIPNLHFEMKEVLAGVDCVAIYYKGHRGNVVEFFLFGADGKVRRSFACYEPS